MNFQDVVMSRHAAKKFSEKTVPENKVDELLELIRYAPSSFNIQPWRIVIVSDAAMKEKLKPHAYGQEQITSCSHLFVFCYDTRKDAVLDAVDVSMKNAKAPEDKRVAFINTVREANARLNQEEWNHYAELQVYLALGNALNGAKALGFDSCPMGGFNAAKFAEVLGLPEHIKPSVLCPIGYASDEPRKKVRIEGFVVS